MSFLSSGLWWLFVALLWLFNLMTNLMCMLEPMPNYNLSFARHRLYLEFGGYAASFIIVILALIFTWWEGGVGMIVAALMINSTNRAIMRSIAMGNLEKETMKLIYRGIFVSSVFLGLLWAILWAFLLKLMPLGWQTTLINIVCTLMTAVLIGLSSSRFFKLYVPTVGAIMLGTFIWFIIAVLIRSIILTLLGVG